MHRRGLPRYNSRVSKQAGAFRVHSSLPFVLVITGVKYSERKTKDLNHIAVYSVKLRSEQH